jgi:hypothetical protein
MDEQRNSVFWQSMQAGYNSENWLDSRSVQFVQTATILSSLVLDNVSSRLMYNPQARLNNMIHTRVAHVTHGKNKPDAPFML